MKVFVVTKTMVDLDGTFEFVGAFGDKHAARAACKGAGTYHIARMDIGKVYSGNCDVDMIRMLGALEI